MRRRGRCRPREFDSAAADSGDLTLWLAMLFAFLGGLILNVMPCVLPILAMKALSLADHGAAWPQRKLCLCRRRDPVLCRSGSGHRAAARRRRRAIGWGFQLQSPIAVAGFALLVFAVGLNLSGLFEVGSITAGEGLASRGGLPGAFFTGVLAVAVAAPCTAPFMAAALGFALTQSAPLGAGWCSCRWAWALRCPSCCLGIWPRALAFIPKPGAWMLTFKQFLAFPMYAAAAWLVWVLAQQAGPRGVAIVLAAIDRAGAGCLAVERDAQSVIARTRHRRAGGAAGAAGRALRRQPAAQCHAPRPPPRAAKLGEAYSADKLASLRAANRAGLCRRHRRLVHHLSGQ